MNFADDDPFLSFSNVPDGWCNADLVTIREAACVLADADPARFSDNRVLPGEANAMDKLIERAILLGTLPYFAAMEYSGEDYGGWSLCDAENVNPHTHLADSTTVRVPDLAAWCESKGIAHPFRVKPSNSTATPSRSMDGYPDELRVAIEAFEAVSRDPAATAKQTPKGALTAWLVKYKPELSAGARERIATVANWQPKGGAPKTPG